MSRGTDALRARSDEDCTSTALGVLVCCKPWHACEPVVSMQVMLSEYAKQPSHVIVAHCLR